LGIVGLVCAFLCSIAGLVISIIAYTRSKAAGYKNNIALAGIIVSALGMALGLFVGLGQMNTQ